jgi:hypothetical protein
MRVFHIAGIGPGHAAFDLFRVSIHSGTFDSRHSAFIAVFDLRDYFGLLAETQIGQGLLGTCAKCLAFLGRINLCQPDFDFLLIVIEHCQGVAIGDAHNFSHKNSRLSRGDTSQ